MHRKTETTTTIEVTEPELRKALNLPKWGALRWVADGGAECRAVLKNGKWVFTLKNYQQATR